jgi:hypothetical protein
VIPSPAPMDGENGLVIVPRRRHFYAAGLGAALVVVVLAIVLVDRGPVHRTHLPPLVDTVTYSDPRWAVVSSGAVDGKFIWRVRQIAQVHPSAVVCLMAEISSPGTRTAAEWLQNSFGNWHCSKPRSAGAPLRFGVSDSWPPTRLGVSGWWGTPRHNVDVTFARSRGHWTVESYVLPEGAVLPSFPEGAVLPSRH